jgi:general secretion pathway protein D
VVDPSVKGSGTVSFTEKVPVGNVYSISQSELEVHGFTTVRAGSIVKIVPASSATGKGLELKEQSPVQ